MQIEILLLPKAPASVVTGLLEFFEIANLDLEERKTRKLCQVRTVAMRPGPILLNGRVSLEPDIVGLSEETTDLVIVPAIGPHIARIRKELAPEREWILAKARNGARIASVCTGAFLLASTGLLDNRSATTHWLFGSLFRRMFPKVHLEIDRLVVDNGTILTSGGSNAFYDLALHIVEESWGREISLACAQHLLLDTDRISQTPFMAFASQKQHGDSEIALAQSILEKEFQSEVSLETLAIRVGLSSRSFNRRFKLATGDPPSVYIQRLRIEWAKTRLTKTDDSIEEICYSVGYENLGFFRALFKRLTGTTPNQYRQRHSIMRRMYI